jgi:hypothetical protein
LFATQYIARQGFSGHLGMRRDFCELGNTALGGVIGTDSVSIITCGYKKAMKSRSQELVEKSVAAMVSAIEVYNKPDFKYREETFAILAINAWELLLKAKWLTDNENKIKSLYVTEKKFKTNGDPYKYPKVKLTACGNPFTHSLDYLSKKLNESGKLPSPVQINLDALREIRDSSVHFYNRHDLFALQLQEVGSATVKNYVVVSQEWFNVDLKKFNFYLMPLAFLNTAKQASAVLLNREERNLASYISKLEASISSEGDYAVTVNVDVRFSRSTASGALSVQLSNDPSATKIQLTEEQLKQKWPFTYETLTSACRERYSDFLSNSKYHRLRSPLKSDTKYCLVRRLDPDNPKSVKQERYSHAVFTALDKHYTKKKR